MRGFAQYLFLLYRYPEVPHNRPPSVFSGAQSHPLKLVPPTDATISTVGPCAIHVQRQPGALPSGKPEPGVRTRPAQSMPKPREASPHCTSLRAMCSWPVAIVPIQSERRLPMTARSSATGPLARPLICAGIQWLPFILPLSGRPRRSDPRSPRCPACRCPAPDDSSGPHPTPVR